MTTAIKRIVMRYLLEADLAIKKSNGDFQTNRYELTYLVENISTDKYNNIQLGPNTLDINQNQFRQLNILEIEIDNIFMELDRSLIKSEDFLRRTIYRYDWIRCKINEYGKIVSISEGYPLPILRYPDTRYGPLYDTQPAYRYFPSQVS